MKNERKRANFEMVHEKVGTHLLDEVWSIDFSIRCAIRWKSISVQNGGRREKQTVRRYASRDFPRESHRVSFLSFRGKRHWAIHPNESTLGSRFQKKLMYIVYVDNLIERWAVILFVSHSVSMPAFPWIYYEHYHKCNSTYSGIKFTVAFTISVSIESNLFF